MTELAVQPRVAVGLRFLNEAHAGLISMAPYAALNRDAAAMESLPAFKAIQQPFIPPA